MLGSPSELKNKLASTVLTLQINDGPDLSPILTGIQDVTEVKREGENYRIKLARTETTLPAIIETVTKKGLRISDITLTKPTLDEVFLQITGNSMRDGATNGDSYGQKVLIERLSRNLQ